MKRPAEKASLDGSEYLNINKQEDDEEQVQI